MQATVDREPRGPKEGIALTVYARQNESDIYQFKIDVCSEKNSGLCKMRLDGFGYLKFLETDSPHGIFLALSSLKSADVEAEAGWFQAMIRSGLKAKEPAPELPDISELAVSEYFEAARVTMLKELAPMLASGHN